MYVLHYVYHLLNLNSIFDVCRNFAKRNRASYSLCVREEVNFCLIVVVYLFLYHDVNVRVLQVSSSGDFSMIASALSLCVVVGVCAYMAKGKHSGVRSSSNNNSNRRRKKSDIDNDGGVPEREREPKMMDV